MLGRQRRQRRRRTPDVVTIVKPRSAHDVMRQSPSITMENINKQTIADHEIMTVESPPRRKSHVHHNLDHLVHLFVEAKRRTHNNPTRSLLETTKTTPSYYRSVHIYHPYLSIDNGKSHGQSTEKPLPRMCTIHPTSPIPHYYCPSCPYILSIAGTVAALPPTSTVRRIPWFMDEHYASNDDLPTRVTLVTSDGSSGSITSSQFSKMLCA
jgi:hypothetical protein